MKKRKMSIWQKNGGCDEDCFNCRYPDCVKPVQKIKTDNSYTIPTGKDKSESQQKMYTVELKHFKL